MNNTKIIEDVISRVGGQAELARQIGGNVTQRHVWNWLHRDKKFPPQHCLRISELSDGVYTVHDLRPDVFGERPAA